MTPPLLSVSGLHVHYDRSHILQGVDLDVPAGGVVAILGRNGAGKTTTLKAIMGIARRSAGTIAFAGHPIEREATDRIARLGIAYVPETRGIFPSLSVEEHLTLAARRGGWTLERVYDRFPRLAERRRAGGGTLSGGEQQMLTIARAMTTAPRLLLLDEPTEGLAPLVVAEIEAMLRALKGEGTTVLLVEQNLAFALAFADHVILLGRGLVRWSGRPADFHDAAAARAWLAV
ncbi:amino acid/amide ABC transporter ATP-binding protein 2 (HAAT family) [Stella humosa]|uniref:Amino acid/amide ABC transporter ATP-binding protein 2 (HAAT family) n=1 Tax=Stella humosa TaxID=94 RepID=A0A3N1KUX5_9PROT|nr:ABC transporter ATP-binding protein [Stella humosa]ROP83282.1 amino acid/amide ABC transporter ATP-binding protein 2 (HAAT family) [Stella humosa]BBK29935.1 ABC transporter ATP-binding protein [Stella humosa]